MKDHILPNKREVIGHYFYVLNFLMVTKKEYLKKRPPFYICKIEVSRTIHNLWSKNSLPIIGQRFVETKLKNLITDYAKANTKQDGIRKLELVNSIFAHASVFIKTLLGNTERSVAAVLRVAGFRLLVRLAVTKVLLMFTTYP